MLKKKEFSVKRKKLKLTISSVAIAAGTIMNGMSGDMNIYAMENTAGEYDANADPYFASDMDLYYQYVESHELEDFLDGTAGIFGDITTYNSIYAQRVKVADFDGDNRAEVWITGPAAVANHIAGILDISDGEVKCVFNGWGSEVGRYTDPVTGETGLIIHEGNADGENCHLRDCIYDGNWNGTVLYDMEGNEEENTIIYTAYVNNEERQLTMNVYDAELNDLYSNCTITESVAEKAEETVPAYIDKQEILDFLQGLKSTPSYEDVPKNTAITNYPEYDEIINQYYTGMISNWPMDEFMERNLCYLAGREMGGADNLGYCLMDINEDGTDELLIGFPGENAYKGMFYDLYTMVDGQRVLVVSSRERDRYYVCQDYTIANEGSGGALTSAFSYYNLISGQLELKEEILFNAYDHPENPWFYITTDTFDDYSTPISEEDGRAVISNYTYMDIPYTLLKEINFGNYGEEGEAESVQQDGQISFVQQNEQTAPAQQEEQISPAQQMQQKIGETESQAAAIETEISVNVGLSGEEYKQKLNELYELWDNILNDEWAELKNVLPSEDMEALTQDEIDWINNKENTVNAIRNVSETDALMKAAEFTKERVYVLLDRLISGYSLAH